MKYALFVHIVMTVCFSAAVPNEYAGISVVRLTVASISLVMFLRTPKIIIGSAVLDGSKRPTLSSHSVCSLLFNIYIVQYVLHSAL